MKSPSVSHYTLHCCIHTVVIVHTSSVLLMHFLRSYELVMAIISSWQTSRASRPAVAVSVSVGRQIDPADEGQVTVSPRCIASAVEAVDRPLEMVIPSPKRPISVCVSAVIERRANQVSNRRNQAQNQKQNHSLIHLVTYPSALSYTNTGKIVTLTVSCFSSPSWDLTWRLFSPPPP